MATRLILNELDLNLATLTARLIIIVVLFIIGDHPVALGAASAIVGQFIMNRRKFFIHSRHDGKEKEKERI